MVFFPRWPVFASFIPTLLGRLTITTPVPPLVPAVHSIQPHTQGDFILGDSLHIFVDTAVANSTLDNGLTLIPPTLDAFSIIFAADVKELFPHVKVTTSLIPASKVSSLPGHVFLTISPQVNSTTANGSPTSDGYEMVVTPTGVTITGAGAKGVFWATRTLLQGLVQTQGHFPSSAIADQPDWSTRGLMLGKQPLQVEKLSS